MNRNTEKYYYGIDAEVQRKLEAKWDPERASIAQAWVESLSGESLSDDFHEALKSGVALCKALNAIKKGMVKKIYEGNMAFKQRENITAFLEGCKSLGMREVELFKKMIVVEQQEQQGGGAAAMDDSA